MQDSFEKKCEANEGRRKKIMVENRKKAAFADREVQESAGVRRMTKAMMEIENALCNDAAAVGLLKTSNVFQFSLVAHSCLSDL